MPLHQASFQTLPTIGPFFRMRVSQAADPQDITSAPHHLCTLSNDQSQDMRWTLVQMLAWSDGDVMDEWTLTKPEGWAPNPQEQERWMGRFQADPPGDFVDSIGVNQGIVDEVCLAAQCQMYRAHGLCMMDCFCFGEVQSGRWA